MHIDGAANGQRASDSDRIGEPELVDDFDQDDRADLPRAEGGSREYDSDSGPYVGDDYYTHHGGPGPPMIDDYVPFDALGEDDDDYHTNRDGQGPVAHGRGSQAATHVRPGAV